MAIKKSNVTSHIFGYYRRYPQFYRSSTLFHKMLHLSYGFMLVLICCGLSACGSTTLSTDNHVYDYSTHQTAAVMTFISELTLKAPTTTETPLPTLEPTMTETPVPTFTPTETQTIILYRILNSSEATELLPTHIAFYFIALDASKECSYYMRPVLKYPYPLKTGNLVQDVTTALRLLFSTNEESISGFLNPLAPTGHRVLSITVEGNSVIVDITGNPGRTDDPCINRQMRDQIFTTIRRIVNEYGINSVTVWVDSYLLYDDYMIGE